jgi:hypothetical protein
MLELGSARREGRLAHYLVWKKHGLPEHGVIVSVPLETSLRAARKATLEADRSRGTKEHPLAETLLEEAQRIVRELLKRSPRGGILL